MPLQRQVPGHAPLPDGDRSGLDALKPLKQFKLLRALWHSHCLVGQNVHMALQVAGRGYVLQTSRIVLHDTAANLGQNERVRKAYLGES